MFEIIGILLTSFFMNGCSSSDELGELGIEEVTLTSDNLAYPTMAMVGDKITLSFKTINGVEKSGFQATFSSGGGIIPSNRVTITNNVPSFTAHYKVAAGDTGGLVTFTLSVSDADNAIIDFADDDQVKVLQNKIQVSL